HRQHVVAGEFAARGDELQEILVEFAYRDERVEFDLGVGGPGACVRPSPELLPVRGRCAEQFGDHPGRQRRGHPLGEFDGVAGYHVVQKPVHDLADFRLQDRHAPPGEPGVDQLAELPVPRRVGEDQVALLHRVGQHRVGDRDALRRAEQCGIAGHVADVLVFEQRPELGDVVPAHRRRGSQLLVRRIRVTREKVRGMQRDGCLYAALSRVRYRTDKDNLFDILVSTGPLRLLSILLIMLITTRVQRSPLTYLSDRCTPCVDLLTGEDFTMADVRPLLDAYSLYIDGQWVGPEIGRYDDISPATEATITTAPDASMAEVDAAIGAARRAFDSGPWGSAEPAERARCLQQLGNALLQYADEFFALAQSEWGCTANERLIQIDGPAFMALRAGELAAQLADEPLDSYGAPGNTLLCHEPLGVVSILTPWNFPHSLNTMKVCNALAAGNTVVLKPSPLTPVAGLALARIIHEHTDIPPGVVNVVTPRSVVASKLLTTDRRIDMVSFTGSSAVGREVMAAAAGTMKRILLECGGKSAAIFLDDLDVTDELLERILYDGCSLHAGQACILQSRLLLPDAIHDEVVDRLVDMAARIKVGDPADPEVQMGPLISRAQLERVESHVATAVSDGAALACGGRRPAGL